MPRRKPASRTTSTVRFDVVEIHRLHPHERIRPSLLEELTERIRRDGHLKRPILVAERDLVILDGHHRVEAVRVLGCHRIPTYLVDYLSPAVEVGTWPGAAIASVTKEEVIRRGLAGDPFPPKTTRHSLTIPLEERPTDLEDLM